MGGARAMKSLVALLIVDMDILSAYKNINIEFGGPRDPANIMLCHLEEMKCKLHDIVPNVENIKIKPTTAVPIAT